uniref:Uncharacterized protein n=1 Tax=Panagrolaimus superbus TaxID=310955 RepID=A0A914YAX8_9BILA
MDTTSVSGFDQSYKTSLSSKSVEYLPTVSPSPTRKYFQYNHFINEVKTQSNGILPDFVIRIASSYRNHGNNNNTNNTNNLISSTKIPLNKQTSVGMLLEGEAVGNSLHGKASMNSVAITLNSDDGSIPEENEDILTLKNEEQNEKENEAISNDDKTSLPSFTLTNPDDVFC